MPKEKTPENTDSIYIIICSIILAILVTITGIGLFLYRRRKQAHFNEIPTVSKAKHVNYFYIIKQLIEQLFVIILSKFL